MSLASSRSPKRRRRNDERCSRCDRKKHLYLVLDDWSGGYSVHKLDPDDMPEHLSEPPAVRVTGPDSGTMSFAALGCNLLVAINPRCFGVYPRAPPTLIYSTETSALTIGPRLPDDHCCDLDNAMATAGGKLYAMSAVFDKDSATISNYWQVLEPTGDKDLWDPSHAWWWRSKPTPPFMNREPIVCHALHPDGRTIFLSTESQCTYSLDTSNGECKELGDWVLPFTGQAHYDAEFDAWVGLHAKEDGCVCLCRVASRSAGAQQPPECTMLREKLCRYNPKYHDHRDGWPRTKRSTTLAYIGNSRYCLVENIPCRERRDGTVVHITLFGLKYGSKGELRTKVHPTTRSYAVSKNQYGGFSHAIFCM